MPQLEFEKSDMIVKDVLFVDGRVWLWTIFLIFLGKYHTVLKYWRALMWLPWVTANQQSRVQ